MALDPQQGELLAQFLGVTVVDVDVDGLLEQERLVQPGDGWRRASSAAKSDSSFPLVTFTPRQPGRQW